MNSIVPWFSMTRICWGKVVIQFFFKSYIDWTNILVNVCMHPCLFEEHLRLVIAAFVSRPCVTFFLNPLLELGWNLLEVGQISACTPQLQNIQSPGLSQHRKNM